MPLLPVTLRILTECCVKLDFIVLYFSEDLQTAKMLGEALAKILRSQLGQYLDTEDLEVKVAFRKPIELKNVKLRESVLRDANLPLR